MKTDKIKRQLVALHPWHLKVEIGEGLTTEYVQHVNADELPPHDGFVTFVDKEREFKNLMGSIYREGLAGKTFLDCACNCGGFCFWAKDLGAQRAFGFDVREHWIKQAQFLKKHRTADSRGVNFKISDLYDVPKLRLAPFDITLFRGIFYHLPDPVTGLKIAADLTRELMYIDTATVEISDSEKSSGGLIASFEGVKSPMSGVHRMNWYPTGPKVMRHLLEWLGFVETRVIWHLRNESPPKDSGILAGHKGRIGILAAKVKGLISHRKDVYPDMSE